MPTSPERVRIHLGHAPGLMDDDALTQAVAAANEWCAAVRHDLPPLVDDGGGPVDDVTWPAWADFAATLQAARLYGRRGSVQGVAAFADAGVSLLARLDPDVRVLLGLGDYQSSVVA